mmetsp:Transcript_6388/g.17040  ORF Transcript_6388/g.17040 Transcript_6388/m.17040 type:complete len:291 (+) Transcript_6388:566-1438(+)
MVHVSQLAQAVVPWTTHYGGGGKVDAPHQLKAHLLASFLCILPAPHLRQAIAKIDLVHDAHVLGVVRVVLWRGHPLVAHKRGPRLQHAENLAVDGLQLGSVASGLNGIRPVKAFGLEGHLSKVAANHGCQRAKALLLVVPHGTLHLVVVDGDAHDVGARHGADRAHGAPDSAATVQDLVPGLGLQHGGDACLMGCLRALPGLVGQLGGEVEALAPAPFVDVGDQAVEHIHQLHGPLAIRDACARAIGAIGCAVLLELLGHRVAGNAAACQLPGAGLTLVAARARGEQAGN